MAPLTLLLVAPLFWHANLPHDGRAWRHPQSALTAAVHQSVNIDKTKRAKVLYLTFDDGPSLMYTPKILDILRQYHAQATFFVLGYRCDELPRIVRRMRMEGHAIGSHGYYHRVITAEPKAQLRDELERADRAIYRASGVRPVLYRPPEGRVAPTELAWIQQWGHPIVMWTIDSQDWKAQSAAMIEDRVKQGVRPGAIILFHDGVSASRYTVQALPELLQSWRQQGYEFRVLPSSYRGK